MPWLRHSNASGKRWLRGLVCRQHTEVQDMQPTDDDAQRTLRRAEDMEHSVQLTRQDEEATVALLQKLDKLSADLFEHAKMWDDVNPEIAANVRKEEEKVHTLRQQVARMAQMEAEEITTMMAEVEKALKQLKGGGG